MSSKKLFYSLAALCLVALLTSGFLAYAWQREKKSLQLILATQGTQLLDQARKSTSLTQANKAYQEEVAAQDAELAAKETALATKQNELNTLSTNLADKQKTLDAKIKELAEAEKRIADQKSQLDANSTELSKLRDRPPLFSFQVKNAALVDAEAKKEAVKQVVSNAYDTIQAIYGKPYLLHSVTIAFVEKFENDQASGEIVIENSSEGLDLTIHIKDFDKNSFNDVNTIIHETIHSFHGLAILSPTAFEEGITVAAADVVMQKMIAAGTLPNFSPLYIRISEATYQQYMSSLSIPRNDNAFYASPHVTDFYQVEGKAWYNLYLQKSSFFSEFNEKIYTKKRSGQEITEQLVLDTVKEVLPSANLTGSAWQLH